MSPKTPKLDRLCTRILTGEKKKWVLKQRCWRASVASKAEFFIEISKAPRSGRDNVQKKNSVLRLEGRLQVNRRKGLKDRIVWPPENSDDALCVSSLWSARVRGIPQRGPTARIRRHQTRRRRDSNILDRPRQGKSTHF